MNSMELFIRNIRSVKLNEFYWILLILPLHEKYLKIPWLPFKKNLHDIFKEEFSRIYRLLHEKNYTS